MTHWDALVWDAWQHSYSDDLFAQFSHTNVHKGGLKSSSDPYSGIKDPCNLIISDSPFYYSPQSAEAGVYKRIWQKISRTLDKSFVNMFEFIKQVAGENSASKRALIIDELTVINAKQEHINSDIHIMTEKLMASHLGLVMADGTPYRKHFNQL